MKKTTNIFIIRSATRVFNACLDKLKKEFPDSRVVVLAPATARESLCKDPLIDEVVAIPGNGRISIFSCGLKVLRRLQNQNFDLAICLYNVDQGLGYSNIDLLAWAAKPKALRSFNSKEAFAAFYWKNIFQKILREKLSSFWVVLNYVSTLVLFFAIMIGIVGEWIVRKLTRSQAEKIHHLEPIKLSNQQ
jgi:hypothetical protein